MITLITDASYGGPGLAGWAAWMKADGECSRIADGPILRVDVASPHDAELAAAANGLSCALKYAPGENVLLQCDCYRALRLLRCTHGFLDSPHADGIAVGCGPLSPSVVEAQVLTEIGQMMRRHPVQVLVRHVKGHSARQEGRYGVNRLCDRLARANMRRQRGERRRAGPPHAP